MIAAPSQQFLPQVVETQFKGSKVWLVPKMVFGHQVHHSAPPRRPDCRPNFMGSFHYVLPLLITLLDGEGHPGAHFQISRNAMSKDAMGRCLQQISPKMKHFAVWNSRGRGGKSANYPKLSKENTWTEITSKNPLWTPPSKGPRLEAKLAESGKASCS